MSKFIILNHKMNLEYEEVYPYINELNQLETKNNIIVCPSSLYLEDFINHCHWGVGAQNVHDKENGNYTGEISTLQLKSMGIEYSIIGHYERKKYFHETTKDVQKKLISCLESNISPILCFGETGEDKDILKDLDTLLEDVSNIDFIIFAYEPLKVKENLEVPEIQEQVEMIYHHLQDKYHSKPNIIYGGGVEQKDINDLLDNDFINGLLIGKISANIEKITKIITKVK
ncbi:MAG: triose-phosphate isomerase family protein [Bacilli bacterium]|nr:triose-phosphate isomerase family protein [Bacilli bacterium]